MVDVHPVQETEVVLAGAGLVRSVLRLIMKCTWIRGSPVIASSFVQIQATHCLTL